MMKVAFYEMKGMFSGCFRGSLIVAVMIACAVGFADVLNFGAAAPDTMRTILIVAAPILTILLFSNLYARDFEEGTFAQGCTWPRGPLVIFAVRLAVGYGLLSVMLAVILLHGHLLLAPLTWREAGGIMLRVLPVHAVLAGTALLAGLLGRAVLTSLAAACGYMLFELMTFGRWTKTFSLFHAVWPQSGISAARHALYLCLLAAAVHGAALLLLWRGKRWLARKT